MPTLATRRGSWSPRSKAPIIPRCFSFRCITPRSQSLTEHLLEPYTEALLFSSSRLLRDPAFLFEGQCVLVLREAYEFIGGHSAISKSLAEDLHPWPFMPPCPSGCTA